MKRHKWGLLETNRFTKQQQCENCGLYRFKALGVWMYSLEKTTNSNPFVQTVINDGCQLKSKTK